MSIHLSGNVSLVQLCSKVVSLDLAPFSEKFENKDSDKSSS